MNPQPELTGKWNALVNAVEQKYGRLSGTELARVRGDMNKLAELVQQKSGQNREQVEAFFDECCELGDAWEGSSGDERAVKPRSVDRHRGAEQGSLQVASQAFAEHPLESLAAALSLGLVLGVLIGFSLAAPHSPPASSLQRPLAR